MRRIKQHLINPVLADLNEDIAGEIPFDLVKKWLESDRSEKTHQLLLKPYTKRATVVSSDSAGLSKLSKQKSLLEVMKLVSMPKELIYAYGKKIGGKGVGVWAADNTQMFYDKDIKPLHVVEQMIAAQGEIKKIQVGVGMAIHHGDFIELGSGLFGLDAYLVEHLAESYTQAGEILITEKVSPYVNNAFKNIQDKKLPFQFSVYGVDYSDYKKESLKHEDIHYPFPFNREFFYSIREGNLEDQAYSEKIYQQYASEQVIVLIKIHHGNSMLLLDQLSEWIMVNAVLKKTIQNFMIQEIKSNGDLGIFACHQAAEAVDFAIDTAKALAAQGFKFSIGIAKGEVLLFTLKENQKEIAGTPVNVASKLAEDLFEEDTICIDSSVNYKDIHHRGEKFSQLFSGIQLQGIKMKVT